MKYAVLVAVAMMFLLSGCSGFDWTFGLGNSSGLNADMPGSVTMDVPNNLKLKNDLKLKDINLLEITTNEGESYKAMRKFVTVGLNLSLSIDIVLSNVALNYSLFSKSMGIRIDAGNGKWFFFNTNASVGSYLYYGESAAYTNLYIDWAKENSKFKGKALYKSLNAAEEYKAILVKYDFAAANPVMDVVMDARAGVSTLESLRVKIIQQSAGRVNVFAKIVLTNSAVNNLRTWELYGYGGDDIGGGVMATGKGSFNSFNGLPIFVTVNADLKYQEYFNTTGASIYRYGSVSLTSPLTTNIVVDDFTSNAPPADIVSNLSAITNDTDVMNNFTYTEPTL